MIPPSPTGRRVLRQLALRQLGRHMAYPDIHPATHANLEAAGFLAGDNSRCQCRLTPMGWSAVGEIVDSEPAVNG